MQNKETKKTELAPKQKSFWPLLLITSVVVIGLILSGILFVNRVNKIVYKNVQIGQESFNLEVAETSEARQKGLSERDKLDTNKGMLFDFKQNGDWKIHMLQMRFPIDIVWLNDQYEIIHIKHNATPAEYPEVYYAPTQSRYVLELESGTLNRLNIKEGDSVKIN